MNKALSSPTTRKTLLLFALGTCAATSHVCGQTLDISEVYGGGGNNNAPYANDFIELYNYGTAPINLSAYSVFYATDTGAFRANNSTALTGSIAPGSFYLIAEGSGGGSAGVALPPASTTGTINLDAINGKVALALTNTAVANLAPGGSGVVDFIGYGDATTFEGSAAAPAGTNRLSIQRSNPSLDTNQNGADFAALAPTPAPEPSTYACFVLGGLSALVVGRSRRRRA